ncbi:hypothetical protein BC624_10551 [Flavobacterium granuli]|uniref:Uncharacterized protein n=1 Tax=Flavobacterium granuli TaxID=280093 RepID=A0A1M5NLW4_9FLAO|nr:hypothetical protein BC624_10551 [Flavobacterium granuli]SHG90502.1 hypothetical protein SAMN05443373_10551 [Flavobacterium granuli]
MTFIWKNSEEISSIGLIMKVLYVFLKIMKTKNRKLVFSKHCRRTAMDIEVKNEN